MFFKILNTSSRSFDDRLVRHWRSRKEFSAYSTLKRAKKKLRMQVVALVAGLMSAIFACGVAFDVFDGKNMSIGISVVAFVISLLLYGLSSNIKYDKNRLIEFIDLNERFCVKRDAWLSTCRDEITSCKTIDEFEAVFLRVLSVQAGLIMQKSEKLNTPAGILSREDCTRAFKGSLEDFKKDFSLAEDLGLLVGRTPESFFESFRTEKISS